MSSWYFIWRFISRKGVEGKLSWSVFLPMGGVVLGSLVVCLTFAIMDGMEQEIFGELRSFTSAAKLDYSSLSPEEFDQLTAVLVDNDISWYKAIERNGILQAGENYRIVKIRAIDKYAEYIKDHLDQDIVNGELNQIVLGMSLANRLDVIKGSSLHLISPLDLSMVTGIPPRKEAVISGIYSLELVDFDLNYAFIPYEMALALFQYAPEKLLLFDDDLPQSVNETIISSYSAIRYTTWEDENGDLISAMKMEKLAYTMFGFMIVFISGFNLLSMMSMSVMRKIPQIGMLRTMGYNKNRIAGIFIVQSIITGFAGCLIGIALAVSLIGIENHYHFLIHFTSGFPLAEFPLVLTAGKVLIVAVMTLLIIIISGIYPARKASKLQPVKAIDYIR